MLGLLYDIHGNLPALEAVLADARSQRIGGWVIGGDVASFGGWPVETVARLDELQDAEWVRGNVDRWLVDDHDLSGPMEEAIAVARSVLGPALCERLGRLPVSLEREDTLFVHASPLSDMRSFHPSDDAQDAELLAGAARFTRVVFGHTHLAFTRLTAVNVTLVNPGSVGMPLDGDRRASYAVLAEDGTVSHRRVEYDFEGSVRRILDRWGPAEWTGIVAGRIRNARFA